MDVLSSAPVSAESTSYVGRAQEGAAIRRLLGQARLVTLAGPGGVGKTRLAARVMRDSVRAFEHGAVFVELAPVRDGALVANLVADRLGLQDRSDASATRIVIEHLRHQTRLLVLDNCEHVIDACAGFVAEILAECPRVVVLATSRQ
ncbi:AAA family ATPase [Amycolatopsis sp. EV170708-02-1]|nr:AAA family ATPase [Amycolatopsis sp. EV170708-02-1]UMP00116.1 AAA family ATPase [Amycolatopsis sp. EV170708-02-1]